MDKGKVIGNSGRWKGVAFLSLLFHLVWLLVFLSISTMNRYPSSDVVEFYRNFCPECLVGLDRISLAAEMGTLEIVSVSLTVLGVVLAVAALGSFFLIRGAAMDAAADAASERALGWLDDNKDQLIGPDVVREVLRNSRFIETLANSVRESLSETEEMEDAAADKIAEAFENTGGEGA